MKTSTEYRKKKVFESGGAHHYFYRSVRVLHRNPKTDPKERVKEAGELIDEFIAETGETPSSEALERLADYILKDVLEHKYPDKTTKDEYPILSDPQLKRRRKTEISLDDVEDLDYITTDGVVCKMPYRKDYGVDYRIALECRKYRAKNRRAKVKSYVDKTKIDSRPKKSYTNDPDYYRDAEYQKWAFEVKKRDKWTCQNPACGSKVREMHAHHLEAWNRAPDLRYDVSNGITLCQKCHMRFHYAYGFGDNTREQFEEWIEKGVNNSEFAF